MKINLLLHTAVTDSSNLTLFFVEFKRNYILTLKSLLHLNQDTFAKCHNNQGNFNICNCIRLMHLQLLNLLIVTARLIMTVN